MANKDIFNTAKAGTTFFMAYLNTVAQEIGNERAVGLAAKTFENMGAMRGKMMKEKAGTKKFDAPTLRQAMRDFTKNLGLESKVVEETPQKVVIRMGACPNYEAAQEMKIDAKAIDAMCHASCERLADSMLKQLGPGFGFRIKKMRSSPSDYCEHELILA